MSVENKNIIAALVGYDRKRVFELRRKYRSKVHIFGDDCGLLVGLLPFVHFHYISEVTPETLSMYINGFAEQNPEYIPIVTAVDEYTDMLGAAAVDIECNCIIMREGLEL